MNQVILTVADQLTNGKIGTARVLTGIEMVTPASRKLKLSFNNYEDWADHVAEIKEIAKELGRPVAFSKPGSTSVDPVTGAEFRSIDKNGVNVAEQENSNYRYSIEAFLQPVSMTPAQVIAALRARTRS